MWSDGCVLSSVRGLGRVASQTGGAQVEQRLRGEAVAGRGVGTDLY